VRKAVAIGALSVGGVVVAGSITLIAVMSSIGSSVTQNLSGLDQRLSRLACVDAVAVTRDNDVITLRFPTTEPLQTVALHLGPTIIARLDAIGAARRVTRWTVGQPVAGYHQSVAVRRLATHAFYIDVMIRGPDGRAWGRYDPRYQQRGTTVLGGPVPSCWRLSGAH
jgi:hypothetical protein